MKREDFRIVPKFYTTSSLTMIFYKNTIVESVEIYKNYKTFEDEASKAEIEKLKASGKKTTKPVKMKTSKEKRTDEEINAECERFIKKYIAACTI